MVRGEAAERRQTMSDSIKYVYSQREKFAWLQHAELMGKSMIIWQGVEQLDKTQQEEFWTDKTPKELRGKLTKLVKQVESVQAIIHTIESNPIVIRDYCKVRQSLGKATTILLSLGMREVSVNELDRAENEIGTTYDYETGFQVTVKKTELSRIAATGTEGNWDYLIKLGIISESDIKKARRRKRRPLFDASSIGVVGRFLVENWCGPKGIYGQWKNVFFETVDRKLSEKVGVVRDGDSYVCKKSPAFFFTPPLCFFENGALAVFCAAVLGKNQFDAETSTLAIRKWISRLGLKRAISPKIVEAKITGNKIYFLTRAQIRVT